jgi:hypothetical protein
MISAHEATNLRGPMEISVDFHHTKTKLSESAEKGVSGGVSLLHVTYDIHTEVYYMKL